MTSLSYSRVKQETFKKNPAIKAAYEALQDEFELHRLALTQPQMSIDEQTISTAQTRVCRQLVYRSEKSGD